MTSSNYMNSKILRTSPVTYFRTAKKQFRNYGIFPQLKSWKSESYNTL